MPWLTFLFVAWHTHSAMTDFPYPLHQLLWAVVFRLHISVSGNWDMCEVKSTGLTPKASPDRTALASDWPDIRLSGWAGWWHSVHSPKVQWSGTAPMHTLLCDFMTAWVFHSALVMVWDDIRDPFLQGILFNSFWLRQEQFKIDQ